MNKSIEPNDHDTRPPVDEQRRRLSRVGLAAPVVLGTMLSRPVLGATYHNCTISGEMSGKVSTGYGWLLFKNFFAPERPDGAKFKA